VSAARLSADPAMRTLHGEHWLARRLGVRGVLAVFAGTTDSAERKRRLRQAITSRGLDHVRCNTRRVTYATAFFQLYGEPL